MTIVQRTRFERWFKNLCGFRAALPLDLDHGIAPVYNLGQAAPELDDENAFWYATPASAGPVAAQFSFLQIKSLSPGARAVIDGIYFRAPSALTTVRFGIAPDIAGAGVPALLGNNFLGQRPPAYSLAAQQLGSLAVLSGTQAADPFSVAGSAFNVDMPTGGFGLFIPLPPIFVVTPGFAFTMASGVVNISLGGSVTGRWLADQT